MFQFISRARWHAFAAVGLLAPVLSMPALAETACEPSLPIDSESLVNLALECSPSQLAAFARWQSQQYQVDAAGRLEDPKLMLGAAPRTFGDDQTDEGYIVELNQSIPWPGTLALQKQAASAQADVWRARVDEQQVDLAEQIRLAFAEWQYHRQLLDINKKHRELWKEFIAVVETKYAAGSADKATVLQAKHEAHLLMEEAIELKAQAIRDASRVKALVGLPEDAPLISAPIEVLEPIELSDVVLEALVERIEQQPSLQRLQAEKANAATELALAKKDRYPDFSVTARYNTLWMEEEKQWVVGVGVNIPLDFGKRSSRERSIRAEQTALRFEQQDLVNALREQLVQAYSLWQQGKETYELYQEELLPLSQEHLQTAIEAYQSGTSDFLTLLIAQRQTLATQRKAEAAVRAQFVALADLTAAAGLVWLADWQSVVNGSELEGDQ